MSESLLPRALTSALVLTLLALPAQAGVTADASFQVSTGAAFVEALAECEELASGEVCTITIAADLEIAHGANPVYSGVADLVIQGTDPDITVSPASGAITRFVEYDGSENPGAFTVRSLTVEGFNYAYGGGAMSIKSSEAVLIEDVTFQYNTTGEATAGALSVANSTVVIANSAFHHNTAYASGDIATAGTDVVVTGTVFTGDPQRFGAPGGIGVGNNSTALVQQSAFVNTSGGLNAAVIDVHENSTATVRATTVAITDPDSIETLLTSRGQLEVEHVTVLVTQSTDVAVFGQDWFDPADITVRASVIHAPGEVALCVPAHRSISSAGYNYFHTEQCVEEIAATDVVGADPGLLPPVLGLGWVLPSSTSPLRDVSGLTCDGVDVRAVARPQGAGCDAGAVELSATAFADVTLAHPFVAEVTWLAASAITGGYADGTFRPNAGVSRQAMAAFLYRFAGSPEFAEPASASFPDVPTTHPFFAEIEWLVAEGITSGYDDGTFRPGAGVSRMAMAAFLYRFNGASTAGPQAASFTDVSTTHPFFDEVEWLAEVGVSTGYSDGTFRPGASVSRMAMAAFLARSFAPLP